MRVSKKWQYALRSIFELARRVDQGPIKVSEIANVQEIPPRFLEVILNQLKRVGIVDSRRGNEGGYFLVRSPHSLSIGEVIRSLDGNNDPLSKNGKNKTDNGSLYGDCVFLPMWEKAWNAMWQVYESTTFQQLIDDAKRLNEKYVPSFTI